VWERRDHSLEDAIGGPAHDAPASPGVSKRLTASTPCVSRGVSLFSRPTYVWRFRYRFCKEPRIVLFGGGASRRSPWTSPSSPSSSTSVESPSKRTISFPIWCSSDRVFLHIRVLLNPLSQVLCCAVIAHHKGSLVCSPLCSQ
jgi:hypothetical protein